MFVCLYVYIYICIFAICAFAFALFLALLMGQSQQRDILFIRACMSVFIFTFVYSLLGAVHILRNTGWGWGLPNLLQYYIGGLFKVYGNITDLVGMWKGLDHFQ